MHQELDSGRPPLLGASAPLRSIQEFKTKLEQKKYRKNPFVFRKFQKLVLESSFSFEKKCPGHVVILTRVCECAVGSIPVSVFIEIIAMKLFLAFTMFWIDCSPS